VHPAVHVVLLEGEARLVEWEDVGMVGFELSEDGSELRVLCAGAYDLARVRDTVHMASTQSTLPVHWYPDWTTRPRRR
jgi:hypothetical protein